MSSWRYTLSGPILGNGIHTFMFRAASLALQVTDGLFKDTGTFYVMKDVDLKPLEELFRAELFRFLKKEGKITDELIVKLMKWQHSGFSIHNGKRIEKDDTDGPEAIAQYMMRNVFSLENIQYIQNTGKVIYRSGKMQGKKHDKRNSQLRTNFTVYAAEEFIAAITQHIPKKSFQTIRYYGYYSNKSRGLRAKAELVKTGNDETTIDEIEVIDVSKYQPENVPSLTWRECIKKIWKNDPLICPECQHEMFIISFIDQPQIIKKILKYLDLWEEESSRDPPFQSDVPDELIYVPIEDTGWEHENPVFSG